MNVIKKNISQISPLVSVILLDWSCRESFHSLDWLSKQSMPREKYEIIWIELYDRVAPDVFEKADTVLTCCQKGLYHKHLGYNIGLLHSKGQIITVCDSDAVFPPDFIASIINTFHLTPEGESLSLVLMHYEWRSPKQYPANLSDIKDIRSYSWKPLWPNVGACMSVRKSDAIRFGGFDEDMSFQGYLCGPYDLGWRLVNAGIPEIWHDESIALWHFAHPDPLGSYGQLFLWKKWREITYPHIQHHALTAVESFSTGRILPLKENINIYDIRMSQRKIGTKFEEQYSRMTGINGFSNLQVFKLRLSLFGELIKTIIFKQALRLLMRITSHSEYEKLRYWWRSSARKG